MATDELIRALRIWASLSQNSDYCIKLLNEAADRLEELDERVAIMEEGKRGNLASDLG